MAQEVRIYEAQARSSGIFGRVIGSARTHHLVVDGPVQNGCPGEEITPGELFLAGVATCAVELMEVLARESGFPVPRVEARITGTVDRSAPVRPDLTVFNTMRLDLVLSGVSSDQAEALVEAFKRR
jgi:organic hydroperoxide reductase OsmC/OhrA